MVIVVIVKSMVYLKLVGTAAHFVYLNAIFDVASLYLANAHKVQKNVQSGEYNSYNNIPLTSKEAKQSKFLQIDTSIEWIEKI